MQRGATKETTSELLRSAKIVSKDRLVVDSLTLNKIGIAESCGGNGFSGLTRIIKSSKPATWHGELTGGIQNIIEYRDSIGVKFIVHEVFDEFGNIVHRDFDAVRIASGQIINKVK